MAKLDMTWMDEHFYVDTASMWMRCKRCDMAVYGLTKHARNVHGDDVEVAPTIVANLVRGRTSDEAGQFVQLRPLLTDRDWMVQDALL